MPVFWYATRRPRAHAHAHAHAYKLHTKTWLDYLVHPNTYLVHTTRSHKPELRDDQDISSEFI